MEKNLLIFISIVLLNSAPSYADKESELPALPTSFEVQVEEKSVSDSSKSFWQKFNLLIYCSGILKNTLNSLQEKAPCRKTKCKRNFGQLVNEDAALCRSIYLLV